jgi:outer membrane protein OmpA-like peptidoglycan-associated protein
MLHIRVFSFLLISTFIANNTFAQKESKLQLQTGFSAFVVNYPKDGKYFKQFNPGILLNGDMRISRLINWQLNAGIVPKAKYSSSAEDVGMLMDFNTGIKLKMMENARFSPYVYAGLGVNSIGGGTGAYTPLGLGARIRINPHLALSWESLYRQKFGGINQPMSHSIGITFVIGKPVTTDPNNHPLFMADSDKDGVPDLNDDCPFDKGMKDNKGCPSMVGPDANPNLNPEVTPPPISILTLAGADAEQLNSIGNAIVFIPGTDELTQGAKSALDKLLALLKKYPDNRLHIAVHTDNQGDATQNKLLTLKQSFRIKSYLAVEKGISPNRLSADGYGDTKPVADNKSESGRRQNRRVELNFIK